MILIKIHIDLLLTYVYLLLNLGEDYTKTEVRKNMKDIQRKNSLFSTTFSKDVIKIRADVLKSIPLTTSSETTSSTVKPMLTTSASISSTDSGKSNKSTGKAKVTKTTSAGTTSNTARQKYQRRKSVSLDGG